MSSDNHPLFLGFYNLLYRPKKDSLAYFLDKLSRESDTFFVVQIGANDGITHDPIHKFIKRDRWHGVLLEPQKLVFQNFLFPLYQKQTGIHTINAALGKNDGEATLYGIAFSNARWATGLASFDRSVIEKSFASGHVARQAKKQGIDIPIDETKWICEEKVRVVSVKTLIETYQIKKIDLLQIDTEGFDFEIIKMFDFTSIRPSSISYEHMHFSEQQKSECEKYLFSFGYQFISLGGNTLAISSKVY
ncbi:MAG: FkbM family methyltransferase [Saprospiraceae bacterium]|nr:FkbM family methyltransferase [Saprospiraceae bacterium]